MAPSKESALRTRPTGTRLIKARTPKRDVHPVGRRSRGAVTRRRSLDSAGASPYQRFRSSRRDVVQGGAQRRPTQGGAELRSAHFLRRQAAHPARVRRMNHPPHVRSIHQSEPREPREHRKLPPPNNGTRMRRKAPPPTPIRRPPDPNLTPQGLGSRPSDPFSTLQASGSRPTGP